MLLNCHTYYSFKYGTISPQEWIQLVQTHGYETAVFTDINSTAGVLNGIRFAKKNGVRPVVGIDFRNGTEQQFVALARNNEGFREINDYLSYHLHRELPIPPGAPDFKHVYVIYPYNRCPEQLKEHEFVGIAPRDLTRFRFSKWNNSPKAVAMYPVTFRNKRDFNAHRLLRAINNNTLLSKLPKSEEGQFDDRLVPVDELKKNYEGADYLLEHAQQLLANCAIDFDFSGKTIQNLKTYTGDPQFDFKLLRRLCLRGLRYRYPDYSIKILRRLAKELKIVKQKEFVSYFLINCKIVSYARSKGYYYVGRGSGANSIVAYLIRITDVDPVDLDLYFERFINLYRQNPPDFDIDFSWRDREDVTRFIFNYFTKKQPGRVALLAAYSTFKYRAATRELGKVFGLPPHEIDKLAEGGSPADELSAMVLKYSQLISGFPSHLTVHAGGILIAEKPIHYFTATSLPPKGFPTTHFDMHEAEDVGLYKFDILGQRGLGKIKDCLAIVKQNRGVQLDVHDFKKLKTDEQIKAILSEGQAIGCFYVESPAMRMLLKKLRVDEYLGLVAASSIIRPGVSRSGMMREYILRYREPERMEEAHPVLVNVMPDTFGVMVYQEDVIKVAHYFAGLDLGEADVLRRGMSGKYRSRQEFQNVKDKYFENCHKKGYPFELAADVWRQIESFAGYAFAKGHSASYAVESYQSLYLKAHYPLEYMVSVLNNGGGFYRKELYIHEARMHGARIEAPCVNNSEALCCIEGETVYLGLDLIKDVETDVVDQLLEARQQGPFTSLSNFVNRVEVSLEQLLLLIRIGAFRFTEKNKKALLWEAHFLLGNTKKSKPVRGLFQLEAKKFSLPELNIYEHEEAFEQIELLGFPLSDPFGLLKERPTSEMLAADLKNFVNKEITIYGYLVAIKNTGTSKGQRMNFGTFIDREGYFIDTVHFPQSASKYPFRGRAIYRLVGKVTEEFDFYTLEVHRMFRMAYCDDPRYTDDVQELKVVSS